MNLKEIKEKWFCRDNLLILILSGVLLFIIAMPVRENDSKSGTGKTDGNISRQQENGMDSSAEPSYSGMENMHTAGGASELEKRLETVLSEMAGVGKVKVMITLESSEELVVEKDEELVRSNTNENDSAGGSRIVNQVDTAPSTVYRTQGSDSEPYVVKTLSPRVEGVVVVAQGAGDGTVNKNITEMVQALFGVEAHKVKVVRMQSKNNVK